MDALLKINVKTLDVTREGSINYALAIAPLEIEPYIELQDADLVLELIMIRALSVL